MNSWPPKDWRAMVALLFSVLGAAVLTLVAVWLCWILASGNWSGATEAGRARTIGAVAVVSIVSVGLVLIGLGFAINRRSLSARWGNRSLDWAGGDEAPPSTPAQAAQATAAAAEQRADEIASQVPDDPEASR
ncbi:hypothetical protein [Tsuneonella sp. HG222]